MTQAKFTPGPWTVRVIGVGGGWDDPVNVCEVRGASDKHVAEHIFEADAHLIAAAHELLGVARMVLDAARDTTPTELIAAATAAIAKAEGQS